MGTTSTGTPESGKKYYIYADTYQGGAYVNRYLYNENGTLKMNAAVDESSDFYVWLCTKTGEKYTFQNVGNSAKYLGHKALADAAYNFTLGKAAANHAGTTIWSDGASRYLVAKNDGSTFDQAQNTYNQTNSDWCTDYVFVEYVEPEGNTLSITSNFSGVGEFTINGKAATLPYKKWGNTVSLPVTIAATASNPYKFEGFFKGEENLGKEYTVSTLEESVEIEARFTLDIFSPDLQNPVPVRINNNRNQAYAIKMNAADSYTGNAVNSGTGSYGENEIWYLVGTAESFKMYSRTAGTNLAVKLAGTNSGDAATLATEGTALCLVAQSDGSFGICPTNNKNQSFNMHGGAGANIKLYGTDDGGSKWLFKKIDTSKALKLNYNAQLTGGYEQNYKIGELSINIDGTTSSTMLTKTTVPASSTIYLPEGAIFGISTGFICHGWTMNINGQTSIENQTLPADGLTANVNIAVDTDNIYQYLYYSPGPNGHPYRIPAIATTANGYVFAINDFRPCGGDIGNGDVDLVMRHSTAAGSEWDGHSWTESVTIANGQGHQAHTNGETWKVGYGDPAIVADRENNELLVMSVCGNRLCWNGNYGVGGEEENPNRIARIRIKFNETTKQWEVGQPEEVTYDIYPLFDDKDGTHHVGSMFIGAGRIAQSSKIKVGTHFRIYCAVWAVKTGDSRYHNYALYSDDFGESWKVLGELGWDNCPAKYGNEPKCEELPDGSVLLSSRKGYGRYFNVFRYTDAEKGEGYWEGEVSTDAVGDLKWGSNDTNGEPLRIGNVLFQSAPTGNNRSNVAVFYKVLSNDPADYTPTKLSNGWTKIAISDEESAYSSMCILPDGENIGIFYEEVPGGYSMVYRPIILKDILPADVYSALSALPPTYASQSSPVWHHITFSATGNVLCDQGAGNNAATATAEENDACMWNIVGTKDGFYLMSKLGNYLAYDATNNRYTTTADKKQKASLILKENVKGSWEIMRKGASKSMSEVSLKRSITGEIGDATICGASNQIAFSDLTPEVYDPAIFSTEKSPVWYQVQFKAGNCYITDQGNGNKLLTKASNAEDTQYWQFIGTPESFYMKSRSGNYVYWNSSNSRFTTSSTEKTELYVTKSSAEGYYEIGRKGISTNTFNQHGGAGADKEISEYGKGDTNNPLRFIQEAEEVVIPYPEFSTEASPKYYWVYFNTSSATLEDKGADTNAKTAEKSFKNEQLWQLVGNETSFYMKNKAGRYLSYNSTFKTTTTADSKATLQLNYLNGESFEIQLYNQTGYNSMNPTGGAGKNKDLGAWNSGDVNNPVTFISTEPTWPTFSTSDEEYWYFIKFGNGGWAIEDKGVGSNVLTAKIDDFETQKWKLTGSKENCQIINKEGHYLVYKNDRIQTSTTPDAQGFKLVATTNAEYPQQIEIQHPSVENKAFNMNGGAGSGKEIALYNSNNGGNPLTFVPIESVTFSEFNFAASNAASPEEKLTLWYTQSAPSTDVANTWMEYSLPIGNGQFGASLFGGVSKDEILFNDKTLWSGGPSQYGNYLPFGSIYIEDISGDFTYNPTKPVKNYYRDLNLKTATGSVSYENSDGVKFTRQYIASNPDKAVVTKITASESGKISLRFTMESGKPTVNAQTTYSNGYATFSGKLETVSYNATMRVIAKGGFTSTGTEGITVEEADEVLVILAGCTDFVGNQASHINGRASELGADNRAIVDAVAAKGWDAVYADHVADHQKFFNRVTLELDGVENNLPTNELIAAYNAASGVRNHMLEQLYYNYGRYLSIASSRGADLPNNLQGIWNNTCTPPWHSDIHANINVQMNYWPVSAGNLDEMYLPFLNYIINEAAQPEWHTMASNAVKSLNSSLGTSTPVRDDSWTCYTENNIFGGYSNFMTNYVIANAWYVTHIWQHYRYTLDKEFLTRAFPAMKGSSLFWADRMVLASDGTYECPNEYSPEHGPGSENAVAHAQQIAWESIDNTIKAADILGGVAAGIITEEDYNLLKDRLQKMDRGLATEEYEAHSETGWGAERNGIKAGDKLIREWKYSRFYVSNDRGHRHMSHLMALYPFGQLTPADEELFEAAINSMKLRGDESTGWSMGWKINLWARALMGDRSHAILRKALKHSTTYGTDQGQGGIYYNLYDSHAPFQIDGNFGACSGINEMLLQSHTDVIDILPALPTEWSKGYVKGLKAVGDFTVDIKWEGNQAQKVTITNNQGQPLYVKCKGIEAATATVNGETVALGEEKTVNGLKCYQITSAAGDEIVIDFSNATQNDKRALETLIEQTEELINKCYDYYATEAPLTATEGQPYYISSNADHNTLNPSKTDGGGIAHLIDGTEDNSQNYFHTNWNNSVTSVTEPHRIDISLGSGNEISSFRFKYATRKAETDFPKTIEIWGKANGEYKLIETVTGLPVGNTTETKYYTSPVIEGTDTYTDLRFVVTETNSGNTAGGQKFWHMAEFDLMPRTAEPVVTATGVHVPAAVQNAKTEAEAATTALGTTQTTIEYNASLAALQKAYDELVAAIESGNLPVLVTTDANNPIVYKIGIKRGDTKVLAYDLASTGMVAVEDYSEGNTLQGWYFTKGTADEKVFIHPYVGGGDILASNDVTDGNSKVKAMPKDSEGYTQQEWTIPAVDAENGIYNIKATTGNNYFSNFGGDGNKMGFYSSANTTDPGSRFTFTRIDFDGGVWKNTLDAYKTNVCTIENVAEGTTLGYFRNSTAYNTARAEAVAILADEYAAESNYKSAYTTLRAAKEAMEFIAPQAGHYYRLKGKHSGNYIDATTVNNDGKIGMSTDNTGAGSIFYLTTEGTLLNYHTGTCLQNTYGIGASIANGNVIYFNPSESGNRGYFTLKTNFSGSKYIYDNTNYIDRNGGYVESRCEWSIEEVTALPVVMTETGYATFYAPVEVIIPADATIYYASEILNEGYIHLEEITDAIPAETGAIVKGEGTYHFTINYDGTTESIDGNKLHGTIEKTLINKESGKAYYILGTDAEGEAGMYNPVDESENDFYNAGHKAYMIIEGAAQTAGYSFNWDGTTGIEGVEDVTDENAGQAIFDLQGRKLNKITSSGIYIIDGKKIFVK